MKAHLSLVFNPLKQPLSKLYDALLAVGRIDRLPQKKCRNRGRSQGCGDHGIAPGRQRRCHRDAMRSPQRAMTCA